MRLGEMLVAEGLVLAEHVERALASQRETGQRLGSSLVADGLATADAVARVLGRQHGVPGCLERHIAGRDASLAAAVPAELAKKHLLVPIARGKHGAVIVAMRDPGDRAVRARLQVVFGAPIVAAAACERVLRRAVDHGPDVDIDIDVNADEDHELDLSDFDAADDGVIELDADALVSLDDVRVTRDPAPEPRAAPPADLDATMTAIVCATRRADIAAAVERFARGRVDALVVLAVRHGMLFGDAGFGPDLGVAAIQAITVPLQLPSVLKSAVDANRPYTGRPPAGGGVLDRFLNLLGRPAGLVVAPVAVGARIISLLVAGTSSIAAAEAVTQDVLRVAHACGHAYARLRH